MQVVRAAQPTLFSKPGDAAYGRGANVVSRVYWIAEADCLDQSNMVALAEGQQMVPPRRGGEQQQQQQQAPPALLPPLEPQAVA